MFSSDGFRYFVIFFDTHTFSLVVKHATVRLVFFIAVSRN